MYISPGWLEPLLDRIAANHSTVVCPVIEIIDFTTFAVTQSHFYQIGGFDWDLVFNWKSIPQREKDRRKNHADPFRLA